MKSLWIQGCFYGDLVTNSRFLAIEEIQMKNLIY